MEDAGGLDAREGGAAALVLVVLFRVGDVEGQSLLTRRRHLSQVLLYAGGTSSRLDSSALLDTSSNLCRAGHGG